MAKKYSNKVMRAAQTAHNLARNKQEQVQKRLREKFVLVAAYRETCGMLMEVASTEGADNIARILANVQEAQRNVAPHLEEVAALNAEMAGVEGLLSSVGWMAYLALPTEAQLVLVGAVGDIGYHATMDKVSFPVAGEGQRKAIKELRKKIFNIKKQRTML